jgi:predicted nucleic acid-binding protein
MKFVDADVFVYWATDHPEHGRRATQILRHIELNEKAVTSTYTLWLFDKVMQGAEGYSLRSFLDQVERIRNLKIIPLEADHLREAAEARTKQGLPMEVAVAYAVARDRGATAIYSTNTVYDRTDLRREF